MYKFLNEFEIRNSDNYDLKVNIQLLNNKCIVNISSREENGGFIISDTENNSRMTLVLALSYSSRWEITRAMKMIGEKIKKGELDPAKIDEKTISDHLCTVGLPDPELLIRTSGENRISNYLLWQIAYAELYFTPKLWPDFRREDLYEAIIDYQSRERRFGLTSEQLSPDHA